jgi:cell division protein FtsZ
MEGAQRVFVVTGLGAGTGTGAAPVIARLAREAGALVVAVATLPFECEGRLRAGHALAGLQALKAASDVVITVPNQSVLASMPSGATSTEVFAASNRHLVDGTRGIWQMLTRPGLVRIDFASLERLLRGRHTETVFATAEAHGTDRPATVVKRLLAHPFLSGQPILGAADAVLLSVVAGPDVAFAEVESVLTAVQRQCEQAQVVTGTAVEPGFTGAIHVTMVVSVGGSAPAPEAAEGGAGAGTGPARPDERGTGEVFNLGPSSGGRSSAGLVPPAPELSADRRAELAGRGGMRGGARRRKAVQAMFNFDVVSRGRFEKTEATVLNGQDLDVPTFIRRGVALN